MTVFWATHCFDSHGFQFVILLYILMHLTSQNVIYAHWVSVPGTTPYYRSQCRIDFLSESFEWLRDQHVVFIGDSVSRYMYLNFAFLVTQRRFAPHLQDGGFPSISNERTWQSWKSFYINTSKIFGGMERCDCFRPDHSAFTALNTFENRYLFVPALNLNVTYLQLFGLHPMSFRNPVGYNTNHLLTSENYGPKLANYQGPPEETLARVFNILPKASLAIVNSGAWLEDGQTHTNHYFSLISTVEEHVASLNAKLVWRTTTAPFASDDAVKTLLKSSSRWEILDTNSMVNEIRKETPWIAWDEKWHVQSFVYEETIRILLGRMTLVCEKFD